MTITEQLSLFFDVWELFRDPTLAGTIAGAMLGLLGIHIVTRRMVFLSAALSQTAGLGVTLTFYAHLHLGLAGWMAEPLLGASILTFLAVALIALQRAKGNNHHDRLLGVIFLLGAAGMLIIGTRIVEELQDIQTLVFGSAVAIRPEDFRLLSRVALFLVILQAFLFRGFEAITFDHNDARVRGLPTATLELLLLTSLALGISTCTRILGALPAFAFSVLPAMAALKLAPNLARAAVLATFLGALAGFLGYLSAFLWDLPVGAAQTLVALVFVALAEVVRASWRLVARCMRRSPSRILAATASRPSCDEGDE